MSSSRGSPSAQNSQVRASRERPLSKRGMKGPLKEEDPRDRALRLRCKLRIRFSGMTLDKDEVGRSGCGRGGVISPSTNSALPSRPVESRTRDVADGVVSVVILSGQDDGKTGRELEAILSAAYLE